MDIEFIIIVLLLVVVSNIAVGKFCYESGWDKAARRFFHDIPKQVNDEMYDTLVAPILAENDRRKRIARNIYAQNFNRQVRQALRDVFGEKLFEGLEGAGMQIQSELKETTKKERI